jgi:hypothetical protein
MGRLYVMSTDGLLVANVFQDVRTGAAPWPVEAKPGAPMGACSMGGEWFGGHFFRDAKSGEYYLIAGGTSYNLIRLGGFETLKVLPGAGLRLTAEQYAEAEGLLKERAAKAAGKSELRIVRLDKTPALDGKFGGFPKDGFVAWSSGPHKASAAVATDGENLCLAFRVEGDTNPMVNAGQDATQLFVTGDSVNLHLGTDPGADPKRRAPVEGDLRLLVSVLEGKPVAVLYRWKTAGEKKPHVFRSPWRTATVDRVERVDSARIRVERRGHGYVAEAVVPLSALGLKPEAGRTYKLDLGVIYSDATGTNRAARVYWSNKATGLTNDVPGEIMADPRLWGDARLAE